MELQYNDLTLHSQFYDFPVAIFEGQASEFTRIFVTYSERIAQKEFLVSNVISAVVSILHRTLILINSQHETLICRLLLTLFKFSVLKTLKIKTQVEMITIPRFDEDREMRAVES